MNSEIVQANVQQLNFEYLIQFRELYKTSPAEAGLRFHIPVAAGKALMESTHEQLKALARSGRMVFSVDLKDLPNAPSH